MESPSRSPEASKTPSDAPARIAKPSPIPSRVQKRRDTSEETFNRVDGQQKADTARELNATSFKGVYTLLPVDVVIC